MYLRIVAQQRLPVSLNEDRLNEDSLSERRKGNRMLRNGEADHVGSNQSASSLLVSYILTRSLRAQGHQFRYRLPSHKTPTDSRRGHE